MSEPLTKEELKKQKNKQAIASMKSAKDNMSFALQRIESLEGIVANFSALIDLMMEHIPVKSFAYDSKENNREKFLKMKSDAMRWL